MEKILFVIIAFIMLTGFDNKKVPTPCNQWTAMECKFFAPPKIVKCIPDSLAITEHKGRVATMKVHFTPHTDPSIKVGYFFKDKPLPTSSRFKTTNSSGVVTLEIKDLIKEDSGVYTIRISSDSGETAVNFTLTVK